MHPQKKRRENERRLALYYKKKLKNNEKTVTTKLELEESLQTTSCRTPESESEKMQNLPAEKTKEHASSKETQREGEEAGTLLQKEVELEEQ